MGSSSKKKKEKAKDFQKSKLKVGKARAKPTNFTDTSFKSKSIVLKNQSIHTTAPSSSSQFAHHISLLNSRSDNQRRDSLNYLTSSILSRPVQTPLQQPVGAILPKVLPLVLDGNNSVRAQLLNLFRSFPTEEIKDHIDEISPYVRAGMTHLAADIRSSTLDILEWALKIGGQELVESPGGWFKTLKCFIIMLGWTIATETAGWSTGRSSLGKAGLEGKEFAKTLHVLSFFLETGFVLFASQSSELLQGNRFPLRDFERHFLAKRSNIFGYLNLFGPPPDEESQAYEDRQDRQNVFHRRFQQALEIGIETVKKEGGETGRAAARLRKVITDGMKDFDQED